MGFFNLFKTGKKYADGKADQAAQAIEDKDPILFAEQDLKQVRADLKTAEGNVASLRATKITMERELKELKAELETRKAQGSKLKAQKGDEAATDPTMVKLMAKIKQLISQVSTKQASLDTILGNLNTHEANYEKLKAAVEEGEADLNEMKAVEQVTQSTEALSQVSTGNADSALAKMKARKKKQQERLDKANATVELQNSGDLDSEINNALGDSETDDIFNSL